MSRPLASAPPAAHAALAHVAPGLRLSCIAASAIALVAVAAGMSRAEQIVITSDRFVGCADTSIDGFDVIVDNAVLGIDCAHRFASLSVRNGGLVTHSPGQLAGMQLVIDGDLLVDAGSDIDATGLGYLAGAGPGAGTDIVGPVPSIGVGPAAGATQGSGGGHGARGGRASSGATGGAAYGAFADPSTPGSGGGKSAAGGRGGGVIRLFVGGTAHIDGTVSASGQSAIADGGGGAGGSILLACSVLEGTGSVRALGGAGSGSVAGGGGAGGGGAGGRIVVRASAASAFGGAVRAFGGASSAEAGGAGTALIARGSFRPRLVLDNFGTIGAITELAGAVDVDGDLFILGGARLGHAPGAGFFRLSVTGGVVVAADGAIDLRGLGHPAGEGRGAGQGTAGEAGGGGGYGGAGGAGSGGRAGGASYGEAPAALDLGSGGGVPGEGGAGGGTMRLSVGDVLRVDGVMRADGAAASGLGGGGAGGALSLLCADLAGAGRISASGGPGSGGGGGGGGGRIAIYRPCGTPVQFTGTVRADGGAGFATGEAGTRFRAEQGTADCDDDGTTDACEIASGASEDKNGNGVPDRCEITLALSVEGLVGGSTATIRVTGGEPAQGVIVAFGLSDGRYKRRIERWCSDFWFGVPSDDPKQQILLRSLFDASGDFQGEAFVPPGFAGREIRLQATQAGTCPGSTMSNLVTATVQ